MLAVLWTLTAVTAVTGAALVVVRLGGATTRNRVLLARAAWAREACVEILQVRYAQDPSIRSLDSVDLGRRTWCNARLEDPAVKLNVNLADRAALVSVLRAVLPRSAPVDSLVGSLLARRRRDAGQPVVDEPSEGRHGPLADVGELRFVAGFTDSLVARLAPFLTVRGSGAINLNAASREVLGALPGMTEETIQTLLMQRGGSPIPNADAVVSLVSPSARRTLLANYAEFVRTAAFVPTQLVAIVAGGVGGTPVVARLTVTVAPVSGRLAVIRRETE